MNRNGFEGVVGKLFFKRRNVSIVLYLARFQIVLYLRTCLLRCVCFGDSVAQAKIAVFPLAEPDLFSRQDCTSEIKKLLLSNESSR